MHIVALVTGILGLVCLPMLAVAHSPAPLFLAIAFGVIAIITGALSRGQQAGKAGLILGTVGVVGTLGFFFLFQSRAVSTSMVPSSSPAAVVAPAR